MDIFVVKFSNHDNGSVSSVLYLGSLQLLLLQSTVKFRSSFTWFMDMNCPKCGIHVFVCLP